MRRVFLPFLLVVVVLYASPVKQGGGPSFGNLDDSPPSSLGEGVDVLKLQVAINCGDRSRNSILGEFFFSLLFFIYMPPGMYYAGPQLVGCNQGPFHTPVPGICQYFRSRDAHDSYN